MSQSFATLAEVNARTHFTCTVPGCDRPHDAQGLCHAHYAYLKRTGNWPTHQLRDTDPVARFWAKVDKAGPTCEHRPELGPCWLWTAATDGDGRYGSFYWEGRLERAHRVSWLIAGNVLPDGLVLDHLCRTTLCVNPGHLEVVTQTENVMRGDCPTSVNAKLTHCRNGHPLSGDNLRLELGGRARRMHRLPA